MVDLYNAISIEYAIPVGGENAAAYVGSPRLVVAYGTEVFDTTKGGVPALESPEPGEVVWRDDEGGTLLYGLFFCAKKSPRWGAGRESLKELTQPYTCKCEIIVTGVARLVRWKNQIALLEWSSASGKVWW